MMRDVALPGEFTVIVVRGPLVELEGWRSLAESDVVLPSGFMDSPAEFKDRFTVVLMKGRSEGLVGGLLRLAGYAFTIATPLALICLALHAVSGGEWGCGASLSLALGVVSTLGCIVSLAAREVAPKMLYRGRGAEELTEVLALETWKAVSSGPHSAVVGRSVYRLEVERGRGYVRVVWRRVGLHA